ncbi:MAG: FkbM family methyltransferase [Phycisphaerales bacterium]
MLGHHLSAIDVEFLRALPDGCTVDLDRQFELERREPGLPSVLWSILWEASAARACPAPCVKRVEFTLQGRRFVMALDLAESPECGYLLRNPTIRLTRQLMNGGATMLDVGANAGFHALTAALFFRRVVAFEPTPATASRLARSIELSGFAHVGLERCALSNRDGEATFLIDAAHCGANRLGEAATGGRQPTRVPLRRLDSMMDSISDVDFIKIDVEGHECEVLEGARGIVARDRPTLVVEFNAPQQFDRFVSLLPSGYRATTVDLDGAHAALASGTEAVRARDVTFLGR